MLFTHLANKLRLGGAVPGPGSNVLQTFGVDRHDHDVGTRLELVKLDREVINGVV